MSFLVRSCVLLAATWAAAGDSHPGHHQRRDALAPAGDQVPQESARAPLAVRPSYDLQPAASDHDHHHGRVQIKVYRGPNTHHGHEVFAPHGFWVKQPADNHHHHH